MRPSRFPRIRVRDTSEPLGDWNCLSPEDKAAYVRELKGECNRLIERFGFVYRRR